MSELSKRFIFTQSGESPAPKKATAKKKAAKKEAPAESE